MGVKRRRAGASVGSVNSLPAGPDSGGFEVVAELYEGVEDLLRMLTERRR
jgi:hypothetical protein